MDIDNEVDILGEDFKTYILNHYKHAWHTLSEETLRRAVEEYSADREEATRELTKERIAAEIESVLHQFTGSENFYKNWLGNLIYTDGIAWLCETAKSYWLIDLIASHQPKLKDEPFQVWTLKRHACGKMTASAFSDYSDDEPEQNKAWFLTKQEIPYSDFPLDFLKLYAVRTEDDPQGRRRVTLMIPSEY